MGSIPLMVIVCAPILIGWLAICGPWYLARRRARLRRQRELRAWVRQAPGVAKLDEDLDRTWTEENEQTEPNP